MLTPLNGKTVIVTGSSKGIGKGIAKVFAKHGANVAVVSRKLKDTFSCVEEIQDNDGIAKGFEADVASYESMKILAEVVTETFGGIDILCSNAGIFPNSSIENMTAAEWDTVMNTNARGALFGIQACLPFLKKAETGRIILTSSITGPVTGYKGWSHYGASKAAQLGFMRSAALELAPYNITINAVMPGNIMTEGLDEMGEEYLKSMAATIPMKRIGTVEDIAYAALFLASKEASYITAQTIVIDGGQVVPESLEAMA